ncbi:hypothetical protein JDV02_005179 [Purpureocillium takamizusanense]|uniref:Uncharacterized protein n=1 Tax=Purpureocillium takamizusanense TaxID=2060973 RepID=A0A9Q8VA33_9HYPO|nr:uncharacterized protein JDV02_005179 [Purpureocillium takamizusanense]UNI18950.1 hypothetical protein JDV02_005179 [Purpureocillium takamizusanense]
MTSGRFPRIVANTFESDDSADKPGIFSEKYRVCTPPSYRMPLSSEAYHSVDSLGELSESLDNTFNLEIAPQLLDTILVPNGILNKDDGLHGTVDLMWRAHLEHPESRLLTVMIKAPWSTNKRRPGPLPHLTTWEYAAMQCRDFVNNHAQVSMFCGLQNNGFLIHVEITSEELHLPRYFGVAYEYLDEYDSWRPTIQEVLQRFGLWYYLSRTKNSLLYQPDAYQEKVNLGSNIGVGKTAATAMR